MSQELSERIQSYLADAEISAAVAEDFRQSFAGLGLSNDRAEALAGQVLEILKRPGFSPQTGEPEIYALFEETPSRTKYIGETTVAAAFEDALQRRARAFSGQIMVQMMDKDGGSIVNVSPHHERLEPRGGHFQVTESDDSLELKGNFSTAVLNNVLHHESPERAEDIMRSVSSKATERLIVLENTTVGNTPEEQEKDRAVQFMHEYLFHRLLQNPATHNTPLPGNYDTADGWTERIEEHGWRLKHRDSFALEPHHTILVFEKDAPG